MDEFGQVNKAVFRTALLAAVGVLAAVAIFVGTRSALASSPSPSITCDVDTAEYGQPIDCTATGGEAISWPDGTTSPLAAAAYAPKAVGDLQIAVVSDAGDALASTSVKITPDIDIQCEDGDQKIVYKLAPSEVRPDGWDYVLLNPTTGAEITPGSPSHPNGGAETGLERIELDRVTQTRFCQIHSAAADDLGGQYRLTLVSPWEGTVSHPVGFIDPASKTRWAGAQQGDLTGTVTVDGVEASERRGVYMAGCN